MDMDEPMDGIDNDTDSFGRDFGVPPKHISYPAVVPKPTASFPTLGSTGPPQSQACSLSNDNCIVCDDPKPIKDASTCGGRHCNQQLADWQGPLTTSGGPSGNLCPVCNKFKPSVDIICKREFCVQRLKSWQGLPDDPQSSSGHPGSSSYCMTVQTRGQTPAYGMCEVCYQRPRYSRNGKTYATCGLTCAVKLNTAGRLEMCDICRQRPKVALNGRVYPHCGKSCRDKANGIGTGRCAICLICWKAPANLLKDEFCSNACRQTIECRAPLLLEIPCSHPSFNAVEKKFKSAWTHRRAPCPTVTKIYMICLPAKREAKFEDYGKKVSSIFSGKKKEEFRWISGFRDCHPELTTPCRYPQCQLCNIIQGTYVPEAFGKGILTTSLPRATHTYERWASNNLRFKASKVVLLSKVYLGRVVDLDSFQVGSRPPPGANSVNILDYLDHYRVDRDEILVYSCEALRPVYLISYE